MNSILVLASRIGRDVFRRLQDGRVRRLAILLRAHIGQGELRFDYYQQSHESYALL
jgi:hypothetical protein